MVKILGGGKLRADMVDEEAWRERRWLVKRDIWLCCVVLLTLSCSCGVAALLTSSRFGVGGCREDEPPRRGSSEVHVIRKGAFSHSPTS